MEIFEKAFNRARIRNTKKRTFVNMLMGLTNNYLQNYRQAINAYNNKNLQSALGYINTTIDKSDINDWKHYAFRANVYEDMQKFKEAISDYEKAIELSDKDINVYALYHQIGYCYNSINNHLKAVEFYSYAIDLKTMLSNKPTVEDLEGMDSGVLLGLPFKRAYSNRANSLAKLERWDESIQDCQKSIQYDNNYSFPYFIMSNIYSKKGEEYKAIEYLKISARLGNKNAQGILREIGL